VAILEIERVGPAHRSRPIAPWLVHSDIAAAEAETRRCPHYEWTPLRSLEQAARRIGAAHVALKDEAARFGMGSFKALGGVYALGRTLCERVGAARGCDIDLADLISGRFAENTAGITICCASDGNHGRAVAAGARLFGCACTVFLHEGVSAGRADAIADYGATIVRIAGDYDDSVRAANAAALTPGWINISDTADCPDDPVPALVMQGYSVMVGEALGQLEEQGVGAPTHIFLQGGVGGLAAAVIASCDALLPADSTPVFIVVEPESADCLFQSAQAGAPRSASGDLDTVMAGLSCGEVSRVAWPVIDATAKIFMTITDDQAVSAMREAAAGSLGARFVCGESGAAGIAGMIAYAEKYRGDLGFHADSVILLFGTEGATDPEIYEQLVGNSVGQAA